MIVAREQHKKKVPKTKTFSGCWTCRNRKVKCDGSRPQCSRCLKGGHQCEGYGLKLYWITDHDTIAPSAIKRQAMSTEGFEAWTFSLDQIDRQLALIDDQENLSTSDYPIYAGPFTVFRCEQASVLVNCDYQPTSMSNWNTGESFNTQFDLIQPQQINTSIIRTTLASKLLTNYVTDVANILPSVRHPENPFASIYVPKALAGAAAVIPGSHPARSNILFSNVAIFFALLSSSAFHLHWKENDTSIRFDVLARDFRGQAIIVLRKALDKFCTENVTESMADNWQVHCTQAEATISAMLNLVTVDIMEGSMSEYKVHLRGVRRFAQHLQSNIKTSPEVNRLLTISSFLSTIADSTAIDMPSLAWSKSIAHQLNHDSENTDGTYGLEFTYGITPTLLATMRRIITLSQCIAYHTSHSAILPPSLESACIKLADDMSRWSIEDEPLSCFFSSPNVDNTLFLARHHVLAFAHALQVYYHTRILPCESWEMEIQVDRVAGHLIQIEEIRRQANVTTNIGTTIVWPGFIASCEASAGCPRDVWYRWWSGMTKHSIGNIMHLWTIVQEAWAFKDNTGSTEVPAWMPILRRDGRQILAV